MPVATEQIMKQPGLILICWAPKATFAPLLVGRGSDAFQMQNVLPLPALSRSRKAVFTGMEKEDSLNYKRA